MINKWLENKNIDIVTKNFLCCNNGFAPKIYGLPKLHKPGILLRPIVSTINSPLYNISKYLTSSLMNIVGKGTSFIKDS